MLQLDKKDQNIGLIISVFATALVSVFISVHFINLNDEAVILSVLVAIFSASIILWIFIARYFRKKLQTETLDYLNIGAHRYSLGLLMIFYGVPKLLGTFFDYQLFALDTKLHEVSEFQLAWFFYGKNKWLELFSGFMEFVPGLLLFNRKTYYIAAILLLPVTAQVFILNLFNKIGGVTFPAATILLACNLYIIYSQKSKIIALYKSLNFNFTNPLAGRLSSFIKVLKGLAVCLIILSSFLQIKTAFSKSDAFSNPKLVGKYTLQTVQKNGISYSPSEKDSNMYSAFYIEKQARWNILRRFNNKKDAFVMELNNKNNGIKIYINTNGTGDEMDILDSATVLAGNYNLANDSLIIKGVQLQDNLELYYVKDSTVQGKKWFW